MLMRLYGILTANGTVVFLHLEIVLVASSGHIPARSLHGTDDEWFHGGKCLRECLF